MSSDTDSLALRRRRALYRACHRGTKEMDWMLGRFAKVALPSMKADKLEKFEKLLAKPDPDVEKWLIYGLDGADEDLLELVEQIRKFHCPKTE